MLSRTRILLATALVALFTALSGCGGGVTVDEEDGNIVFTGYVLIPPLFTYYVASPAPRDTFPSQCVVWEYGDTYTLYGEGVHLVFHKLPGGT